MYEVYEWIAPRVDDWPVLVRQVAEVVKIDYDWSAESSFSGCSAAGSATRSGTAPG